MARISRLVSAVALALVVGVFTLPLVFSDLGPGETVAQRIAIAGIAFFVGGALVGGVAARQWPVAALCAWTPIAIGLVALINKLTVQGQMAYWAAIATFLLAPAGAALLGGYVGSRVAGRSRGR